LRTSFIIFLIVSFSLSEFEANPQINRIIVLGDLHYDLMNDHDMTWLKTKPDDLRQVTQEYTVYTAKYWIDFMKVLGRKAKKKDQSVDAIIQLGDFSEGLAGSPEKANQMANNAIKAIEEAKIPVPWIIIKGNHDITGPGAQEAFQEFWVPMIRKQTKNPDIKGANYSYTIGNIQIVCLDPWDKGTDIVEYLDKELSSSKAVIKFVAIHEPVIPVTERCWHVLRNEPDKREKLLEIIAKNKAIVLCGHLHRYSVVKRNTDYGPITQVMAISVIRDRNYLYPKSVATKYGPSLVDAFPSWEPQTSEQRREWLAEESKYVTYYSQTDLPGYAIFNIDSGSNTITLEYFAAFGKEPFETINLSKLP
jgi:Calcineurin-like phosphoesterase